MLIKGTDAEYKPVGRVEILKKWERDVFWESVRRSHMAGFSGGPFHPSPASTC